MLVFTLVGSACKEEAGPRLDPRAEEACQREPELSLEDFCDQSDDWREACSQYETYGNGLEHALDDCSNTAFPFGLGECDLRVINRSLPTAGTLYYYDGDELVGIRSFTDRPPFPCPEGSPRDESVSEQVGGRIDEDCDSCHVCGATIDPPEVCEGETAEPFIEMCRDNFDFEPECEACACERCYPWTFTENESTNELFQTCIADNCPPCTMPPDEEDGGMEDPIEEEDDAGA